ncbi:MAG: GC-type dockerin domain-anchored protein [Phycisphaerales bacterium JB039]
MRPLACGLAALVVAPASLAQDILIYWRGDEGHTVLAAIPFATEYLEVGTEERFLSELASRDWDLVALELYERPIERADLVAPALESHLARGGALYVTSNRIDDMPAMWKTFGLSDAEELTIAKDVLATEPMHPSWGRFGFDPVSFQAWPDGGDALVPARASTLIGVFDSGEGAVVLAGSGRIIVNGFDWDSHPSLTARDQMTWLLSCPPDLTGDGSLDLFDFLRFQSLFSKGDPLADFCFDGSLDLFDFLAFQNAFAVGCG